MRLYSWCLGQGKTRHFTTDSEHITKIHFKVLKFLKVLLHSYLVKLKKKITAAILSVEVDLKSLHDAINKFEPEEDSFDVFRKSVAMQLKKFLALETS